jgi:hypothetical protein
MMNLLSVLSIVSTLAFAGPTFHKTPNGKYPIYYEDVEGQDNGWNEDMQRQYDWKMGEAIEKWCVDSVSLKLDEQGKAREDAAGHFNQYGIHAEKMKTEMADLSATVLKGTHKSVEEWGCP